MFNRKWVVNSSEIGQNGFVRPTNLINMIQDCEGLHIDSLTKFNQYILDNHFGIFLTYRQVDFYRFPKFKDLITIETSPYDMNAFFGYRNTVIYDENSDVLLASYALGSFVDLKTGKPGRLPEDVYTFKLSKPFDMTYTKRKVALNSNSVLVSQKDIEVLRTHIDYYQHVNNMFYVEFGYNSLPKNFTFNRIRVEYRSAVTYPNTIKIETYQYENTVCVVVKKGDIICALIEFSTFVK